MPESIAQIIVLMFVGYAAIGVLFALVFVTIGVTKVDAAARGSGVLFRVLIVPGCAALWPVLLVRWLSRPEPAEGGS